MQKNQPEVGLFITCLIDLTSPKTAFASVRLLEEAGCKVTVPAQTCCGQPAFNNGNRQSAIDIAQLTISTFESFDVLVVPSASCAGMIRHHYPALFQEGTDWHQRATQLSQKTFELIDYLYNTRQVKKIETCHKGRVAYHESCSARREMKIKGARELLNSVEGLELVELEANEECCGFGGLFSIKYSDLSNAMVEAKAGAVTRANIDILTGVDLGCLHNIAGKLQRNGIKIEVGHIAEILSPSVNKN